MIGYKDEKVEVNSQKNTSSPSSCPSTSSSTHEEVLSYINY